MAQEFDATLDPDGRVTVPEAIRAYLDLGPGQNLRFLLHDDGTVELVNPRPAVHSSLDPDYFLALRLSRINANGADVLNLLGQGVPAVALQEAGLGLLVALEQNQPGAADVATTTANLLDERGWPGDRELADLLRSRSAGLDRGQPSVPADLEMLVEVLDRDPNRGFGGHLKLDNGEVVFGETLDDIPELAEEIEQRNWLYICRFDEAGQTHVFVHAPDSLAWFLTEAQIGGKSGDARISCVPLYRPEVRKIDDTRESARRFNHDGVLEDLDPKVVYGVANQRSARTERLGKDGLHAW